MQQFEQQVEQQLAEVVRVEGGRVVAVLARALGGSGADGIGRAEDAVQEASLTALQTWPETGVPDEPRAWLLTVARRKALDTVRREQRRTDKEAQAVALIEQLNADDEQPEPSVVDDDLLRLVFTCCHPALAFEARVALTLRTVCGLTVADVARVLLLGEDAAAKRLVRTRQKIARAGIPYRVPADADLPARLRAVAAVVHLVFTAGYAGVPDAEVVRVDLCTEAIRLARLLDGLLPGEATLQGLLALMLLTHARRDARVDERGNLVLLADQDRGRWHRDEIDEGQRLLAESLRRSEGLADRYQLEAAIASLHVSAEDVDRAEVLRLYDLLLEVAPSRSVTVNRAVALAEAHGPEAALPVLDQLVSADPASDPASLGLHAAHADVLRQLGRFDAAAVAYRRALACRPSAAEHRFLSNRLESVGRPEVQA